MLAGALLQSKELRSLQILFRESCKLQTKKLSDCNRIPTHNHLIRKQTLIYLGQYARWLRVRLPTKWLWIRILLQSLKLSDIAPVSSKEFLDIQAIIECIFTLKRVCGTINYETCTFALDSPPFNP